MSPDDERGWCDHGAFGPACPKPGDQIAQNRQITVGLQRARPALDLRQSRDSDDIPRPRQLRRNLEPLRVFVAVDLTVAMSKNDDRVPTAGP